MGQISNKENGYLHQPTNPLHMLSILSHCVRRGTSELGTFKKAHHAVRAGGVFLSHHDGVWLPRDVASRRGLA